MKTERLFFVALLLAVTPTFAGMGCDCGDDDDDSSGDDDETGPVETVEEAIEKIVRELDTGGQAGTWVAYVTAEPLDHDVSIEPADGTSAFDAAGDYWFAFVDEDPFAYFAHQTRFVFIDVATGAMTVEAQMWWPEIDGESLLGSGRPLVQVFASSTPEWRTAIQSASIPPLAEGPAADYGDAPDNTVEDDPTVVYFGGAISGRFPTLYETDNSVHDFPGAHALTVGQETLGAQVSAEIDANDLDDPDGVPNLTDNDRDDRLFWTFRVDSDTGALTIRFLVNVTVAAGAPDVDRYLNILTDHNRDGQWKKNERGPEWVVENFVVRVPPGQSEWVWTDATAMPLADDKTFGWESWIRVTLTRVLLDGAAYGEDGWDGSGQFDFGEVEDHYFNFEPWSPNDGDDDDDPKPEEPEWNAPNPDPKDCTYICEADQIEIAINCKALVLNFGDRPGQQHVTNDAERAQGFFETLLGASNVDYLALPTVAEAVTAMENFMADALCLDELYLYLVGHGGKSGFIRAQNGGGKLTPAQLKQAITSASHCPDVMDYYAGECRDPGYCDLNVVLMSCFAGNFAEGDNSLAMDGVNLLTASDRNTEAQGAPSGEGGWVSGAFFAGFEADQADQAPWGDGDGEVSPEEAMAWAKDNHGGPDTGANAQLGADCECVCNSAGWTWDDPEDDLIYWYQPGEPDYVGHLDLIHYGIVPTATGFDAHITTATDLPGSTDLGFHEYYAVFDTALPNYGGGGVTHDGDTAYIAQFLNGVWKMFRFVYNDGLHEWQMQPTSSTVSVEGNELVMSVTTAESGLDFDAEFTPTRMATWYREDETLDAGDDTQIQDGRKGKRCR